MNAENLLVVITQHRRALSHKPALATASRTESKRNHISWHLQAATSLINGWSSLSLLQQKVLFGRKTLGSDPKLIAFSVSELLNEICSLFYSSIGWTEALEPAGRSLAQVRQGSRLIPFVLSLSIQCWPSTTGLSFSVWTVFYCLLKTCPLLSLYKLKLALLNLTFVLMWFSDHVSGSTHLNATQFRVNVLVLAVGMRFGFFGRSGFPGSTRKTWCLKGYSIS